MGKSKKSLSLILAGIMALCVGSAAYAEPVTFEEVTEKEEVW